LLVIGATFASAEPPARQHLVFEDTFESGVWHAEKFSGKSGGSGPAGVKWKQSQMQGDYSGRVTTVGEPGEPAPRSGRHAMRFEWRTDGVAKDAQGHIDNNLKKAHLNGFHAEGLRDQWYGFSIYFPKDGMAADSFPEVIAQWHELPDFAEGETWRNPPVDLGYAKGRLHFSWKADPARVTKNSRILKSETIDLGAPPLDRWVDFVIHIKFDPFGHGLVQGWMTVDGERRTFLDRQNVAIGYNDANNPYFCIGIYKYGVKPPYSDFPRRVIYFDEIRIGDAQATYADVAP
jgi:hypothetical protein